MAKKKNLGFLTKFFIMTVFIFVIFLIHRFLFRVSLETVVCKKEPFKETYDAECMIVFNQKIYPTGKDAEILVKEGERVGAGTALFKSGVKNSPELTRINLLINEAQGKTKDAYFSWIDSLREANLSGDIVNSDLLLNNIQFSDTSIFFQQQNAGESQMSLEELERRKIELENEEKDNGGGIVYSEISGIATQSPSKLNPEITPENIDDIKVSDFETGNNTATSDKVLRVVDNFKATLVLRINKKEFNEFPKKEGDYLRVEIAKDDEIIGSIKKIKSEGDFFIIYADIRDELHSLVKNERENFPIIKFSEEVFKIPKESIIRDGAKSGAFINFKGSIVKYVPVNILKEGEGFVYLSTGKITDPISKKEVSSLNQYDEVFLHPEGLKENEILDWK